MPMSSQTSREAANLTAESTCWTMGTLDTKHKSQVRAGEELESVSARDDCSNTRTLECSNARFGKLRPLPSYIESSPFSQS
jgi:hypothetical protein